MTLYNLRSALDDYRITKFTADLDVESSYLMADAGNGSFACECPAGTRPTCRHRQMLHDLLPLLDTPYFWDFERKVAVDANDNLRPAEETVEDTSEDAFGPLPNTAAIDKALEPEFANGDWVTVEAEAPIAVATPASWRRI
jgi:hypothetical protein